MIRWILFFVSCFLAYQYFRIFSETPLQDPDLNRNVSELISSKGYPVQDYTVQTADGYLLSMQRIPHGRNNSDGEVKDAVLLIHGSMGDATNWVLNFPNQSLGFVLSDAGYDVWLLNTRGCTYSKKHVKYTTHQYEFWNFSFSQMAQYDVPAVIDYILDATGKEDIFIIGHSQGNTDMFALLSDRPDYNDKVKLFIALAPVATVKYISSPDRMLVPYVKQIFFFVDLFTYGEFMPNNNILKTVKKYVCGLLAIACEEIMFAMGGTDKEQLNLTRLAVYAAHFPAGTSTKCLMHYAQLVMSGKFRKYDYGRSLNMEFYHQEEPPDYDVSRITAPVALMWSTNDKLADTKDVEFLRENIKNLILDYQVPYQYDHFDFILALNSHEMINKPILQLLSKAERQCKWKSWVQERSIFSHWILRFI